MDTIEKAKFISRELRLLQEKHKNDIVPTFGIRLSDMAKDSADSIDGLLELINKLRKSKQLWDILVE